MRKIAFFVVILFLSFSESIYAADDQYEAFIKNAQAQVKELGKIPIKQRANKIKDLKKELDNNILQFTKLTEKDSLDSDSVNRKILEHFHFLDIKLEPTMTLIRQKAYDKKSCTAAKNKTEIEDGSGRAESSKPTEEATLALSIIRAICS